VNEWQHIFGLWKNDSVSSYQFRIAEKKVSMPNTIHFVFLSQASMPFRLSLALHTYSIFGTKLNGTKSSSAFLPADTYVQIHIKTSEK
jgi:hypothetical protein